MRQCVKMAPLASIVSTSQSGFGTSDKIYIAYKAQKGSMFLHKTGSGRYYFYSPGRTDGFIHPEIGKGFLSIKEAVEEAIDSKFEVYEFESQKEAFEFAAKWSRY